MNSFGVYCTCDGGGSRGPRRGEEREREREREREGEREGEREHTCTRECDVAGCAPYIGAQEVRKHYRYTSKSTLPSTT